MVERVMKYFEILFRVNIWNIQLFKIAKFKCTYNNFQVEAAALNQSKGSEL